MPENLESESGETLKKILESWDNIRKSLLGLIYTLVKYVAFIDEKLSCMMLQILHDSKKREQSLESLLQRLTEIEKRTQDLEYRIKK
ncbi:MAG: hypothetical protein QW789_03495 [Nitrososphaerota archaeon]